MCTTQNANRTHQRSVDSAVGYSASMGRYVRNVLSTGVEHRLWTAGVIHRFHRPPTWDPGAYAHKISTAPSPGSPQVVGIYPHGVCPSYPQIFSTEPVDNSDHVKFRPRAVTGVSQVIRRLLIAHNLRPQSVDNPWGGRVEDVWTHPKSDRRVDRT